MVPDFPLEAHFPNLPTDARRLRRLTEVFTPCFSVKETREAYVFLADVPGLREEDLDVEVCDGCLTIAGEREQEDQEAGSYLHVSGQPFGTFCLSFQLPCNVDGSAVNAQMADGVLQVKVPKGPLGPVPVLKGN